MRSYGRLILIRRGFILFFNELDTRKELCSWPVSFFNEVDIVKELSSREPDSFIEVDIGKELS